MTQPEVGVTEVPVALNVVQRLPDQSLLLQEALVGHQEVQVALGGRRQLDGVGVRREGAE